MKYKALLLLVLALVFGGIAAYLVNSTLREQLAAQADMKPLKVRTVVVAAADLPIGTKLEPALLRTAEWPETALPEGSYAAVEEALAKQPAVVLQEMRRGDIVLAHRLASGVARRGLTVKVPDGWRAVSVPVNEVRGVGGFIHPGDRVDVLHTSTAGRADNTPVTRTLLQDVIVLAVDQAMDEDKADPQVGRVITLLVEPEAAKKLTLAQHLGDVALTLRNEGDRIADESALVGTDSLWTAQAKIARKDATPYARVQVIRGLDVKQEAVTIGKPTPVTEPGSNAAASGSPDR